MAITLRVGRIPGQIHEVVFDDGSNPSMAAAIAAAYGETDMSRVAATVNGAARIGCERVHDGDLVLFRVQEGAGTDEAADTVDLIVEIPGAIDARADVPETATFAEALASMGVTIPADSMLLDEDAEEVGMQDEVEFDRTVRLLSRNVTVVVADERNGSRREYVVERTSATDVGDLLADVARLGEIGGDGDEIDGLPVHISLEIRDDGFDEGIYTDVEFVKIVVVSEREVEPDEDEDGEGFDGDDDVFGEDGEDVGAPMGTDGLPAGVVEIKIGRIPGTIDTYAVPVGTTVAEALALTGRMPEAGETVRMNGMDVRLEDRIQSTQSLLVFRS